MPFIRREKRKYVARFIGWEFTGAAGEFMLLESSWQYYSRVLNVSTAVTQRNIS